MHKVGVRRPSQSPALSNGNWIGFRRIIHDFISLELVGIESVVAPLIGIAMHIKQTEVVWFQLGYIPGVVVAIRMVPRIMRQ